MKVFTYALVNVVDFKQRKMFMKEIKEMLALKIILRHKVKI